MNSPFDEWLEWPVYDVPQAEKENRLAFRLQQLTRHHADGCEAYRRILNSTKYDLTNDQPSLHSIPYLPVQLFKRTRLLTGETHSTVRELNSSGTTGHAPSRIFLDQQTTVRQSKALVRILQNFIGSQRLPMLIVDSPPSNSGAHAISAREAANRGMRLFARSLQYACQANPTDTCTEAIGEFHAKHSQQESLIFGNTAFMWNYFLNSPKLLGRSVTFPNATLIHTGGWKKLQSMAVSKEEFKQRAFERFGISRVHDYYGMAEQVGSIYVECEHGYLHAPSFADVIVRDAKSGEVKDHHERGIIQTVSLLPLSYPGHSILTEDYGVILGSDDCKCGRLGKYFIVDGRVPNSEARGCANQ